jgi:hypothetical protein
MFSAGTLTIISFMALYVLQCSCCAAATCRCLRLGLVSAMGTIALNCSASGCHTGLNTSFT